MNPHFQQLLDQFEGNIQFKELKGKLSISPDELIYMIETDQGSYFIFETDFISDFEYIEQQVKERTESFSKFVEVKTPPENFEDTPSAKYYTSSQDYPHDFEQFKKYVSFGYGSFYEYYTFLIKK